MLGKILIVLLLPLSLLGQNQPDNNQNSKDQDTNIQTQSDTAETDTDTSGERMEKMEVTGSYIKRSDIEGPSPVVTIDRATIEASGFNSVGQLLRADTSAPFGGNGNFISLRGLGTDRTLILIDGQRAPRNASSYDSQGSNVNLVPLAAVERIEILKDGASATYGSEAIGGVVNIITRRNMDGIIFSSKYDISEPNGGDVSRSSIAYASNSDKGSFLASLQYTHRQGLRISDLDYRKGTINITDYAPNFETSGALKAAPNCPTEQINSSGECSLELSPIAGSLAENEWGGLIRYTHDIDSDTQFYTTFIGRYNQDNSFSPGSPFSIPGSTSGIPFTGADAAAISTSPVVSGLSPSDYNPGDDITIYSSLPNSRDSFIEEYVAGLIVGTKGYWGNSDWSWDVSINNQFFVERTRRKGVGLFQETKNAILNGSYNPFSSDPQDISGLTVDAVAQNRYQVNWANFISSGDLGEALGGSWSAAFGISAAHFEYREDSDDRAVNTTLMGLVGADAKGERQLYAGFAELSGVFANKLETQFALRFDQYSDFGNTLNPKFAVRYQPIKSLTFRSSVGTGFNAPSLQQAYGPQLEFFLNNVFDPTGCDAVGNDQTNENCKPLSVSGQRSTNPDLKEETSINFNLGIIAEPIKYFTISVDYWRVKVENVIIDGDYQKLLELEQQGVDISKYNATTVRNPVTQRLERITLGLSNAGTREVDGIDTNVGYLLKSSAGDFKIDSTLSYIFSFREAFYDEFGNEETIGQGGQPRWRNVATLGYNKGWFGGQFIARTTSRVERQSRALGHLEQFTQYDLNFDFSLSKTSRLSVGAINVFNQRPQLDLSERGFINTDIYRPFRITYVGYRGEF